MLIIYVKVLFKDGYEYLQVYGYTDIRAYSLNFIVDKIAPSLSIPFHFRFVKKG